MHRYLEDLGGRLSALVTQLVAQGLRREEGQTLVEYALIIVTISIGVTVAMAFLRDQLISLFSNVGNAL
jgi:Flp pilus assembly pilin Flp